jgi:hypothetical protein
MKVRIGLVLSLAICAAVAPASAAVIWSDSVSLGARTTAWTGFGMVQNQGTGSNAALGHTFFIDDVAYTSDLGQESQSFDSQAAATAAGWTEQESRDGSNEFGYSSTANAGGQLGEGGGFLARIGGNPGGDGNQGLYGDLFGSGVSMTSSLTASGKMSLNATTGDGSFFFGWLNAATPANDDYHLGFVISEAGTAGARTAGEVRIRIGEQSTGYNVHSATVQTAGGLLLNHPGETLRWTLNWDAGTQVLSGSIFTVPEPAAFGLLLIGLGAGLVGRNRTK